MKTVIEATLLRSFIIKGSREMGQCVLGRMWHQERVLKLFLIWRNKYIRMLMEGENSWSHDLELPT